MMQSEQAVKGKKLYAHYCMHCHGETGKQNEGFNWSSMTDPETKDPPTSRKWAPSRTRISSTRSRDMKDTSPNGDKIGDDEFAVPTMPTFKYTLSEEEIWGIVGYVRSLHGKKLEFNVEGRKKEPKRPQSAEQKYKEAERLEQEAEKKASDEADKKGGSRR